MCLPKGGTRRRVASAGFEGPSCWFPRVPSSNRSTRLHVELGPVAAVQEVSQKLITLHVKVLKNLKKCMGRSAGSGFTAGVQRGCWLWGTGTLDCYWCGACWVIQCALPFSSFKGEVLPIYRSVDRSIGCCLAVGCCSLGLGAGAKSFWSWCLLNFIPTSGMYPHAPAQ